MNDRLRVIRDQVGNGDDVLVLNHGHRPRPARVVSVLRNAVSVRYADEPAVRHTVKLKDVQRIEAVEPPDTRTSSIELKPTPPVPPVPPAPPPAPAARDDVQAWLEMGGDIVSRMSADAARLCEEEAALRQDAASLIREADELAERHRAMVAHVQRIAAIIGVQSS